MATYIKDLVEDNGDITRPVTEAGAVLLSGGGDLETTLASKASQTAVDGKISVGDVQSTDIVANAVTTAKIANGAVTTAKIDDDAVTAAKVVGGEGLASLAAGGLVELVGTPPALYGQGSWAWKFADGRLINFQRYKLCTSATSTVQWGGVYSRDAVMTPVDYAVPFVGMPVVSASTIAQAGTTGNHWIATDTGKGTSTPTHPPAYQPVRGSSGSVQNIYIDIIAYGFWK